MRVVGTFHPPSSVARSVKCSLTEDASLQHLVLAKTDKLEVYSLRPDGLKKECVTDMWGRIVGLQAVPSEDTGRSDLLVMTDHPDPNLILMSYVVDAGAPSVVPIGSLSLYDRALRQSEFVVDFQVDPTGSIAVASCYTGKLKVVVLEKGKLGAAFDVSHSDLYNLLAFTFLHTESHNQYTLALLHLNHRQEIQLISRDLDLAEYELSPDPSTLLSHTLLPRKRFPSIDPPPMLIPVAGYSTGNEDDEDDEASAIHRGGVLVLGGTRLSFYEHASDSEQETRKGKQSRVNKRRSSGKKEEIAQANAKERERASRTLPPRASVRWPWAAVTAWCDPARNSRRFILGDAYGRLSMLAFDDKRMYITLLPLGETSPATCMTYLSSQVLYVGSHFGDSQIVRIHPSPIANSNSPTLPIPAGISTLPPSALAPSEKGKGRAVDDDSDTRFKGRVVGMKGTFIEVLQTHSNIAPICDALLEDIDGSGQPQVVTCSGDRNTGSLRVIRTEADFREHARIDGLQGITDVWPVRPTFLDFTHTHLAVSVLQGTLIFAFSGKDSITHLDPASLGFVTDAPTYALGNIPRRKTTTSGKSAYVDSPLVVQITPKGVQLVECDPTLATFDHYGSWTPRDAGGDFVGRQVIAGAMSPSQYVVGLSGCRLVLLNLDQDDSLKIYTQRDFLNEICAISCNPFDPSKNFTTSVAVSFWGSNCIEVLNPAASLATTHSVSLSSLPCSVLLHNFGTGTSSSGPDFRPHLLAGLADGTVATYEIRGTKLAEPKTSSLGNAPASLSVCAVEDQLVVFASGARASVLHWNGHRLRPSPVAIKVKPGQGNDTEYHCIPSCLAIATSSSLLVGNLRGMSKMQISTIPLGSDLFGVACTKTAIERVGDIPEVTSSFKLIDAHSFQQLDSFACKPDEVAFSVCILSVPGPVPRTAFCVGTVVFRPEETEPSHGRIVVLGVSSHSPRSLEVLASHEVYGAVYTIEPISDALFAAGSGPLYVTIFRIEESAAGETMTHSVTKVAEWNHNYAVTQIAFDGTYLLVCDAISSVSVVQWNEEREKIECVARDYSPLWPMSIATSEDGVIGSNSDCNLFSFVLQSHGQRKILERNGIYFIDDVVNKIIPGRLTSVDATGDQTVRPSHVFFTASGRIGAIMEVGDAEALHMTALQRNMAKTLLGPGEVDHTKWRSPANEHGHSDAEKQSLGFLDGDFLETFLSHPDPEMFMEGDVEAERITIPITTVKDVLVQMQSLH
ncbi:CPSF A subunit region-domain-containing protein [Epithele typhae]|uniref:CPSF A subunit region-domain-containing protein n=1 Tax=Epithele typhae TaxID=378194 RepID=UPI002008740A|nr:CPSF A subunit region-domain-containing protein [Epithele typhae]KAH9924683.1 CPSF A subunit region-domain-containing protein [Epithele typhae]